MFSTAFIDLPPLQGASGTVTLPGSKSISNRVLLLSALCRGTTVVHDLLDSDDTRVMLAALRQLGCGVQVQGTTVTITGLGSRAWPVEAIELFMGNAGTAMRPLTAALAVQGGDFTLKGVPRMHERPIGDLVDALRELGCAIDYLGNKGYPPLRIRRPTLQLDKPIPVRGDVSSQFLTALLMALPLAAEHLPSGCAITIEVVGELISKPYIEITLNLLARFGIAVERQGWERFVIPAGSRYQSPGSIHVEADASSASYFIALGAIAKGDGIRIQGVGADSIQGDIRFMDAAAQMGAKITSGPNWLEIQRGAWPLKGITLDCNHIPDAAMTLAVMALYADGPTTLRNIASWRVKETDRIVAMATESRKLGATVEEGPDWITIHPLPAGKWQRASIHTYDDHRLAMCFSLAAFNADQVPVRIEDPKCVAKTFPDYFEALFSVAYTSRQNIPVICIDGPTASGKGTLASRVAAALGYHYLDSGALYRVMAHAALQAGLTLEAADEAAMADLARQLPVRFSGEQVLLNEVDVTDAIRSEQGGMNASKVSMLPAVRKALIDFQHSFQCLPGLLADGRDMGTVIFPSAPLKVFLTASATKRAERRHKQLILKGFSANIDALRADLEARDARDMSRSVAPLLPAQDALQLDNSSLTIEASVEQVLVWWQNRQVFS
ncbi:MAG: bifunctional 3-phosphoshikimate 1-carboxyvinyltransferase/cytidylate kinase [Limnohabitans sp.]|jgi:3-phosphoshikimate 1-carboxyvinyltransferase|uniref:bifunctional 3-phosphoshikimate 1-carboxyvinyltransferase/cytidylate kinase n=1 Tax=Limnohabitans sp. TaxID=1907725 RepID=UPI0025EDB484|nr:bifunctional 3-phosphoshikimate 1-carboxyvinyltransferase/cytidylate kinase [Limnohabitans sp.]MCO4089056.1 bifunctional 3-phosphoshikimate 1-carboxyvinyltransferase/cytidylate kinase [Limnohabitans sp.]